jgi:hypothetical protein
MNLGKALAMTAVTGMLAGLAACGGEQKPDPNVPSAAPTETAPAQDKNCCKGKNECKGKSGCKTEQNATCAGQNDCKGKGTACAKPS